MRRVTEIRTFARAKDNCKDMVQSLPSTKVTCSFNGVPLDPLATP